MDLREQRVRCLIPYKEPCVSCANVSCCQFKNDSFVIYFTSSCSFLVYCFLLCFGGWVARVL